MGTFFADLWASLQIFYSNFNARFGRLFNAVIVLAVLALVGYFITCNVRLTELNKKKADGLAQLSALQSEEVRLNSELAGLTSAERVNQYVQEQGMLPVSSSQIYYIEAPQQDQVSVAQEEEGFFAQVWNTLADFFS